MHAGIPHRGRCCIQRRRRPSVSDSRDSLSAATRRVLISAGVVRCASVWSRRGTATGGRMASIDQDRQKEGHTLDRGGCGRMAGDRCHGRHSQNGSGPANHGAAFGAQPHVPSSDDNHHQPTTPRRGTPTSRSRSRPRRTASLLLCCPRKGLFSLALSSVGPIMHPRRVPGTGSPSHTHFTPSNQYPPSQDLPETPSAALITRSRPLPRCPSAASQQPLYTQHLPRLASVPDASR